MRHLAVAAVVCVALVSSACGGDTHASLSRELQTTLGEYVSVLETIKDVETARAAKPKLLAMKAKVEALTTRAAKLPEPTEAELKALEEQFGKDREEIQKRLMAIGPRIMLDPAISAELAEVALGSPGGR